MTITEQLLSSGATIAIGDTNQPSLAIDYSGFYERIATSLETLATNSTDIKSTLDVLIASSNDIKIALETIQNSLDTIATNSTTITQLASGNGIHTVGPWDWLGYASLIEYYQEAGIDPTTLKDDVEALPKTGGFS
jgi:hypothetical protein